MGAEGDDGENASGKKKKKKKKNKKGRKLIMINWLDELQSPHISDSMELLWLLHAPLIF